MKKLLPLYIAVAATLPGLACFLLSVHPSPPATAVIAGAAIQIGRASCRERV